MQFTIPAGPRYASPEDLHRAGALLAVLGVIATAMTVAMCGIYTVGPALNLVPAAGGAVTWLGSARRGVHPVFSRIMVYAHGAFLLLFLFLTPSSEIWSGGVALALVAATYRVWLVVPRPYPWPSCVECGYNLTGNTSGRCPECGEPASVRSDAQDAQGSEKPDARAE